MVSSSSRSFINDGCAGPLKVMKLRPDSTRTRSAHRRRLNSSLSLSSSQSSWSRRPRSGVAPARSTAFFAASTWSNLSLISRSSVAGMANRLQRNRSARPGKEAANEDIHGEALDRERRETEIAGQRHFENPDVLEDWDRVNPLRPGPVVPELPQESAEKAAAYQVDQAIAPAGAKIARQRFSAEPRIERIEQENEAQKDRRREIERNARRSEQGSDEQERAGAEAGEGGQGGSDG